MQYQTCANKNKKLMKEKCAPLLENECLNSPIRSIKTVRLSMEVAGRVMASRDNVWIIHLMRDPKAVTLSRKGDPTFRGVASNLVSEANMYCQAVLQDIHERKTIEKNVSSQSATGNSKLLNILFHSASILPAAVKPYWGHFKHAFAYSVVKLITCLG